MGATTAIFTVVSAVLVSNPRRSAFLVVRTAADPLDLTGQVVGLIRGLDPDLPATNIRPLSGVLASATQEQRAWRA